VKLFWEAGVPKEVVQFINCEDEPVGSKLIADERVNAIILTGATATAKLFMKLRPGVELHAETGGKNGIIVTALADRDLAIKDVVASAFGHSGQKCSACSLLVLEKEVYDDKHFLANLKDAVESIHVGTCWDLYSKVIPLVREPSDALERALTTLEPGEKWLVEPQRDGNNPNLWSPGVKMGVKKGSFCHQTELFGPVLSVMRANDLEDAINIVNATAYGLTSGLQSLDEREQTRWRQKIVAGNCYINRGTTGAIVRRQPFGGTKASSFGGGAKAGGPNYVMQFASCQEIGLPHDSAVLNAETNHIAALGGRFDLSKEELATFHASLSNYAYWGKHLIHPHDPSLVLGQDNLFCYRPHHNLCLRVQASDTPLDVLRSLAAACSCGTDLYVSIAEELSQWRLKDLLRPLSKRIAIHFESKASFENQVKEKRWHRIRLLSAPSASLVTAASQSASYLDSAKVLAHGRLELLHYLREVAFSIDYHRYGNLGLREAEKRHPVL
jgi:RHH-type proline utilization regulon transcriptional repressor/proline dehydrogenase/delta 1-pyrroline-5-carboxylate dehydrogenase